MEGEINTGSVSTLETVLFGPFRLNISARRLERGGDVIPIGSRALDLLVALIERAGEVLSKRELIERAWPNLFVDEANLRVHIANLRKCLADDRDDPRYVANVPSRGYVFIAPVRRGDSPSIEMPAAQRRRYNLPAVPSRIVGREHTIAALAKLLEQVRFVSLVGPGGLGKTTLALSLAHHLRASFNDEVAFVDLSVVIDPDLAAAQVASTLGCQAYADDPCAAITQFIRQRRLLLVLDNCEHVIEAISELAEQLFRDLPALSLLTTSREALRVEGETVHFVEPLAMPEGGTFPTLEEAARSAAVRLFLDRSLAGGAETRFTDADAATIVEICRRLDGIPLAIELAASRVGTYGLRATAKLLNDRLELLWRGRRSAPSRHQTLSAMLDWSYHLLSPCEQSVFAHLSIFVGPFSLSSAQAVSQEEHDPVAVSDALASLVDKSLLSVVTGSDTLTFRLLDTTRSYAREKLTDGPRRDAAAWRHALYVCRLLDDAEQSGAASPDLGMLRFLGDVRAALAWVSTNIGKFDFGPTLVVRAVRLLLKLSLLREARAWCERVLIILPVDKRGGSDEVQIHIGLAISAMFTAGNSEEVLASIQRGLELADSLGSGPDQLTLLSGLHLFLVRTGKFEDSLGVAARFDAIASRTADPVQQIAAQFMLGTSYHLVGRQDLAVEHCGEGLRQSDRSPDQHIDQFGFDHRIRALVAYARSLWLSGSPDRAAAVCRQVIHEAEQLGQPTNICIANIYCATVLLWRGDLDQATQCARRLMREATVNHLAPYAAVGRAILACAALRAGDTAEALPELHDAIATMRRERHEILISEFWCMLAESHVALGRNFEACAIIDTMRAFRSGMGASWQDCEGLRIAGEAAIDTDEHEAQRLLTDALTNARAQRAAALVLRAALSLAKLQDRKRRSCDARIILAEAVSHFTEGFETADLRSAARILNASEPDGMADIIITDAAPATQHERIEFSPRLGASDHHP